MENRQRETYEHYINSSAWRRRAKAIKEKRGYTCEICGNQILKAIRRMSHPQVALVYRLIPDLLRFQETFSEHEGKSPNYIVAHHKTYARLGNETDDDIAVICAACHVVITENEPRLGLDGAWQFGVDYITDLLEQIDAVNQQLLNEFIEEEQARRQKRTRANARKSFSWLLPPQSPVVEDREADLSQEETHTW